MKAPARWPLRFPLSLVAAACLALGACAAAPPGSEGGGYFPASYEASRARFRADCGRLASSPAAQCRRIPLSPPDCAAPGEASDLDVDTAFFPAGGDRLLVVQSGIHGAEAPAGASVQALLMERHLERLRAGGTDVLLVHAVNPWGFRHRRRTNACNVNLNRNFDRDGRLYGTANPDYDSLRSILEPPGPVARPRGEGLWVELRLLGVVVADGFDSRRVTEGLDSGQFNHPEGLNFGGRKPAPETLLLRGILRPHLSRPYRSVLLLDIHTGLGDSGVLAMIEGISPPPAPMARFRALLGGVDGQGIVFRSGQSPGFFPTLGDVIDDVPGLAPDPQRVLAVTMEFGTLGAGSLAQLRSAAAMVLENQAHHHGCATPAACGFVADGFRRLFDPPDPDWQAAVLRRAGLVFDRLADGAW